MAVVRLHQWGSIRGKLPWLNPSGQPPKLADVWLPGFTAPMCSPRLGSSGRAIAHSVDADSLIFCALFSLFYSLLLYRRRSHMSVPTWKEKLLTAVIVLLGVICFQWLTEPTNAQTPPPSTIADILQAYLHDAF
jgi:hypothetical protein